MTKTTAPTKAEELKVLDVAIATLGPNSYLAPWLEQVKAEVARDLTSDFIPVYTLAEARQQADAVVADARRYADQIVKDAEAKFAQARSQAYTAVVAARRDVEKASKDLERIAGWVSNPIR